MMSVAIQDITMRLEIDSSQSTTSVGVGRLAHSEWLSPTRTVRGDDRRLPVGRWGNVRSQSGHEGILGVELQRGVVATLEADRRDRVRRQTASADRARVVGRVDQKIVGETEQPPG